MGEKATPQKRPSKKAQGSLGVASWLRVSENNSRGLYGDPLGGFSSWLEWLSSPVGDVPVDGVGVFAPILLFIPVFTQENTGHLCGLPCEFPRSKSTWSSR